MLLCLNFLKNNLEHSSCVG